VILHDRVTLNYGGTARTVPAEVVAVPSDFVVNGNLNAVVTRYRVVLSGLLDISPDIGTHLTITWRGLGYWPDGAIEQHMLRGNLHHLELLMKRISD
jgi:hypothetical protein